MSFTIFYIEKTPLQPIKTKNSKSRKTEFFPKGLTHRFSQKLAIFPTFFFWQYRAGKCVLRDFVCLGYKIKKFKKSKNCHFFNFFFQAIQARKMSFTILYNEQRPFQAIKTRSSKSRKIEIFPKRLTHGCGQEPAMVSFQKWLFCQLLFFRTCRPGKCVLRDSRTKKRLSRL